MVMPMESEIAALKAKLSSSEDRVKELEAAKVGVSKSGTESQAVLFIFIIRRDTFLCHFIPFMW